MQQVGGRKLKTRRYKGGVEDENQPLNNLDTLEVVPEAPIAQDLMPAAPIVQEVPQPEGNVIVPLAVGGNKEMKGGDLSENEKTTIEGYVKGSFVLQNKNKWDLGNNVMYASATKEVKQQALQNVAKHFTNFIGLLNVADDTKMTEIKTAIQEVSLPKTGIFSRFGMAELPVNVPSSGGKKSKKQRGGADEMIFSKMYNTQGLIEDTNDPIQNALAYNNTADQIPQPFSSGSSGAASYTSGIDPTFLQDVLPVLGMVGGKKKSKRNHK